MKLFEQGIEIQEKEFLMDSKEFLEKEIINYLNLKILNHKQAFKNRWMRRLESDPEVTAYPKNIDDCIRLIKSRPWYKSDEQIEKEREAAQSLKNSKNQYKHE